MENIYSLFLIAILILFIQLWNGISLTKIWVEFISWP